MDRRTFVRVSVGGAAYFLLPLTSCNSGDPELRHKLSTPRSLSRIHDTTTLRELGEQYRQRVPAENQESRLVDLLMTNAKGEPVPRSSDSAFLQDSLKERIEYDFMTDDIVVIQGWVLATTEARQCALLSFATR